MLLANGNMIMNITKEQARAEKRGWIYLGDLAGIAERFQEVVPIIKVEG